MADKTSIEIKIEAAGAANSVKDLRTSLKSLKDELNNVSAGSQEFKKISTAINETEGKLGDLNDSFNTLTGSGVERTSKSVNLLKEGFATFDFGKIKASLGGLTAAFRAVPIFLLVEGITYLITHFKELSEGTGIVAKALKPIKDIIGFLVDGFYALTDSIGLTNSALDEMGESVVKNAQAANAALDEQNNEYDRQIKVAKAAGKSTIEIEQAKQQAIIDTNVQIVKQIEAFVRAGGVLDDEKKKLLTASLEAIKNAKVEEYVITQNHNSELAKLAQKAHEEAMKQMEKENEERAKKAKELDDYRRQIDKDYWADQRKNVQQLRTENDAEEDENIRNSFNRYVDNNKAKIENSKETAEKEKQHRKEVADNAVELSSQATKAAQGISDLYYASQLKAAKGNAAKEKQIRKEQFNVNKAFGITNAVIDGVRGVQSALAMGPPAGYVFAALSAVMAGINIAKIASAKFDEGGSSGTDASMGSVGSSASGAPPPIANPSNTVDTTKFGDGGKNLEMTPPKTQVVETEITAKQKIVTKMEGQAVF